MTALPSPAVQKCVPCRDRPSGRRPWVTWQVMLASQDESGRKEHLNKGDANRVFFFLLEKFLKLIETLPFCCDQIAIKPIKLDFRVQETPSFHHPLASHLLSLPLASSPFSRLPKEIK